MMRKIRSLASSHLVVSAVDSFCSTSRYQVVSSQAISGARSLQSNAGVLGKCGFGGKWGKGRQVGTVWHQRERSLGFAPMERAKEAVNAARMKAWAAMPRLPQLPPLPPKVVRKSQQGFVLASRSILANLQLHCLGHCWPIWSIHSVYVATAILLGGYIYFQRRFAIDPEVVYRLGLLRLNTHSGILEVMGAPLAGSDLRSYVLSGGGVRLEGGWLKHRSRRVHMMFPLKGSERRGLVFLEAKKRKGHYDFKVLGVDVPSHGEQEERLYAIGNSSIYSRGGVLASLRDPVLKAHMLKEVHEHEDDEDDLKEATMKQLQFTEAAEKKAQAAPKTIDNGGGMFSHERLYWGAKDFGKRLQRGLWPSAKPPPSTS